MPHLTFLGIENPLGVLGQKVKGVLVYAEDVKSKKKDAPKKGDRVDPTDERLKWLDRVNKEASNPSNYAVGPKGGKYQNRAGKVPKEFQQGMVDDTITNRDYLFTLLKNKTHPNLRIAMCSSLNSLLKYLAKYCGGFPNAGKFDTVIIFGHGAPGSINMGLSTFAIEPAVARSHEKYAERSEQRLAFGLDTETFGKDKKPLPNRIRDLSVENKDIWTGAFVAIKNHVVENDESNHFHLFLMGCEVAQDEAEEDYTTSRQNVTLLGPAAKKLTEILGLAVCVSAPTETINESHLDDLLDHIQEIREDCATGVEVSLSGTLSKKEKLEKVFVRLVSRTSKDA
jgi:hypothetical protein